MVVACFSTEQKTDIFSSICFFFPQLSLFVLFSPLHTYETCFLCVSHAHTHTNHTILNQSLTPYLTLHLTATFIANWNWMGLFVSCCHDNQEDRRFFPLCRFPEDGTSVGHSLHSSVDHTYTDAHTSHHYAFIIFPKYIYIYTCGLKTSPDSLERARTHPLILPAVTRSIGCDS